MADADRFAVARSALAALAMPVVIVGAEHEGRRSCATGTAMYVSFAPPRLAIAQHPGSKTTELIERSERFSLSLLAANQLDAAVAAGRGARTDDKFAELGLETVNRPGGAPAVAEAPGVIWCHLVASHDAGDHRLFIGEVTAYDVDRVGRSEPLLRHRRRYAALGSILTGEAPEGYPT